jgi:hypothetical protein
VWSVVPPGSTGAEIWEKHQVEGNEVEGVAIGRKLGCGGAAMSADARHTSVEVGELALYDLLLHHGSAPAREPALGNALHERALHGAVRREIEVEHPPCGNRGLPTSEHGCLDVREHAELCQDHSS